MDLSNILTISGKPGLHKLNSRSKSGLLVESLIDGKKIPVFAHDKVSALSDISILCSDEDIPLKKVFATIFEQQQGAEIENVSGMLAKEITSFFTKVVPNYDIEKVYNSDMKKVFSWYNILLKNNLIDLEEEVVLQQEKPIVEEN